MKKMYVVAALIISSPSFAQKDSSKTMDEVVVTATKFPKNINETGKVVTVIDHAIIERSAGKSVSQLLNEQAGFTINGAQGVLGSNQDLHLRGAAVGKTLILLDGVPVYDPSGINAAFDLNSINMDNVERIEIVKGGLSTLYGSDAVAGVVNIISKKGKGSPFNFNSTLSGGSYGTFKGTFGINGQQKNTDYNFSYSRTNSDGFSTAHDSTSKKDFDKDGFHQDVLYGSVGVAPCKSTKLRVYGQYSEYHSDLDAGAFADDRDYTQAVKNYTVGASGSIKYKNGTVFFNYNYNSAERKYLNDSGSIGGFAKYESSKYTGRSHFAEAYTRFTASKFVDILFGGDYRFQNSDQNYLSISAYGPYETKLGKDSAKASQYSAFTSFVLKSGKGFNAELGGRFNHHSQYGDNFTYSLNPSYQISEQFKIFFNVGSAYQVPTLYQLYDGSIGNTALKPTESTHIDGGIQYQPNKIFKARVVYFNRDEKNSIDFNSVTNKYFNYSRQKDHGLEVELNVTTDKFFVNGNYTYVTGQVTSQNVAYDPITYLPVNKGDTTYNNLFRIPQSTINLTAGFTPVERLTVSASLKYVGKRQEPVYGDKPIDMSSYTTVGLYGEYKLQSRIKIFADLKNLFDTKYYEVYGYNTRGFNFMAGLNIKL